MNYFTEDSGGQFESIVLAECTWQCKDYVPYKKSIEIIKQNQGCWNPIKPYTVTAAKLKKEVAKELGVDYTQVKFYTALGDNPGDRHHGFDAFIEFNDRICPIDLTTNPYKHNPRSLVISKKDLFDRDDEFNQAGFCQIAKNIVAWLGY